MIRKGKRILVEGVTVLVTKRVKWNDKRVKIHFQDCGYGLPRAQFGTQMLEITEKMYDLDAVIELAPTSTPTHHPSCTGDCVQYTGIRSCLL